MKIITGIQNGRPIDEDFVNELYKQYEGKKVEIEVKKHVNRRSNPQNRYWRGVVLPLIASYAKSYGEDFTEDEWHEYYKAKGYFGYKDITIGGETLRLPKGSSESDAFEFNEAKERVQREWAIRGLYIPDPDEKIPLVPAGSN